MLVGRRPGPGLGRGPGPSSGSSSCSGGRLRLICVVVGTRTHSAAGWPIGRNEPISSSVPPLLWEGEIGDRNCRRLEAALVLPQPGEAWPGGLEMRDGHSCRAVLRDGRDGSAYRPTRPAANAGSAACRHRWAASEAKQGLAGGQGDTETDGPRYFELEQSGRRAEVASMRHRGGHRWPRVARVAWGKRGSGAGRGGLEQGASPQRRSAAARPRPTTPRPALRISGRSKHDSLPARRPGVGGAGRNDRSHVR